jgi:hypothetical protein
MVVEPADDLLQQRVDALSLELDSRRTANDQTSWGPKLDPRNQCSDEVPPELGAFEVTPHERPPYLDRVDPHCGRRVGHPRKDRACVVLGQAVVARMVRGKGDEVRRARLRKEPARDNVVPAVYVG